MRKHFVSMLAATTLALGACQREPQASGDAVEPGHVSAASDAAPSAAQAESEAAFLGRSAPPPGFTELGGHIEQSAGHEIHVIYGQWARTDGAQRVMFVQRAAAGDEPGSTERADIVSVFAIPQPQAVEIIFTEYCTHPDYSETTTRIYASAGTSQRRPGLSDPPSAAWRLDRANARLLPVDAARVTCAFDHME